ncbi:hypothetical protein GTR04_0696 [Trichophyton interdigitale]|nr:hypothetical protein GY631_1226 [Trichophyton interdigitale]KAF3899934.1 hypothetical protein GY632_1044 [Trichophyton interdigitale]KAG8211947.1 hypothetical protein GTR04_0696 [Trichophyton interdigitale]
MLTQGNLTSKFFSAEGEFCAGIPLLGPVQLQERETSLKGPEKLAFLRMVRKILQWQPENRSSAKELERDEWIQSYF